MEKEYPPRVLVKTWLDLINSEYISEERKKLITINIERIFSSLEIAELYIEQNEDFSYQPKQFGLEING